MQTISHSLSTRTLSLLALILLVGCATNRVDWNSRIGTYTYDSAVVELGPPDKEAKLQDGTIVAEWLTDRGGTMVYPDQAYHSYPVWYATPATPTYIDTPDYFLRLTFDPSGRLQSWKRFAR